jgi:uncharacterized membrane protein YkvA (DUF1232 family)
LKRWVKALKRDAVALWIAARDKRTPFSANVIAGCVAAYALSPVDLIPDFIPILGYLDELVLLPFGIALAVRLIPGNLMTEFRLLAKSQGGRAVSRGGLAAIIMIWLLAACCILVGVEDLRSTLGNAAKEMGSIRTARCSSSQGARRVHDAEILPAVEWAGRCYQRYRRC